MSENYELIGKVRVDYSYYSGVEETGEVEDALLEIVKNTDKSSYGKVILEKKDYQILYYLSSSRENIINWFPISKNSKVLEIGAECGALTGVLCSKAASVVAVDPSKTKSLINAYRYRDYENLEIKVGEIENVLDHIEVKFDLITCLTGKCPDKNLIRTLKAKLSPEGRIVIATGNKNGLKYLAGCAHDDSAAYTRKELERLVDSAEFYYAYPDHRFPTTIYSDSFLPKKGELINNIRNFDSERYIHFDESTEYDYLIDEGIYPSFANSFVLVLGNEPEKERVIYAKISDERDTKLQIITEVIESADGKTVRKYCKNPEGMDHLRRIKDNEEKLRIVFEGKVDVCKSSLHENYIEFEYITGENIEDRLSHACGTHDESEIISVLNEYYDILKYMDNKEIVNVDLIPANIIVNDGKYTIIDYEWVTDEPTPIEFVFWRGLFSSISFSMLDDDIKNAIYDHYKLSKEIQELYFEREEAFQKTVSGSSVTLRDYIAAVPCKTRDLIHENEALVRKNNELEYEIQTIKNSRAWTILKKLGIFKG